MIKNSNEDEWIVGADYNNKRIDYFLKKKLTSLSYPIICKLIRKGQLKVNGKKINNSYFLKNGDSIKLYFDIEQRFFCLDYRVRNILFDDKLEALESCLSSVNAISELKK